MHMPTNTISCREGKEELLLSRLTLTQLAKCVQSQSVSPLANQPEPDQSGCLSVVTTDHLPVLLYALKIEMIFDTFVFK